MRRPSPSTLGLLAVLLLSGLGFASLRLDSVIAASVAYTATRLILALATVGVFCRPATRRSGWIGFAAFGWIFLYLATTRRGETADPLPTRALLEALRSRLGLRAPVGGGLDRMRVPGASGPDWRFAFQDGPFDAFLLLGQNAFALLAACLGAVAAHGFFGRGGSSGEPGKAASQPFAQARPASTNRARRRGLTVVKLMGFVALVALGLTALRNASMVMAGAVFLATCVLLGVALLGAIGLPAGRRLPWLGAALFGWGYMALAFVWTASIDGWATRDNPTLPTTMLLDAAYSHVPYVRGRGVRGYWSLNRHIELALDRPALIRFAEPTRLEDVVLAVRRVTAGPDFPVGVPIWVDPNGLQEQDKTMDSTVTLDHMDGAPLRTSLRLALTQLDLDSVVDEGILKIVSKSNEDAFFWTPDEFLRIGHCLFSLQAAAIGGLAGAVLAARRDETGD